MKFHYSLSEKDLVDYFIYKIDADPKRRQRTQVVILIISLFYFFLGLSNLFREKYAVAILFIALGVIFYFTINPLNKWYTQLFFKKKIRKDLQAHIGQHTHLSFEDAKIVITDDTHTGVQSYPISSIEKIVKLKTVTLILLTNNESIIISNETISPRAEFDQKLISFSQRYHLEIISKEK